MHLVSNINISISRVSSRLYTSSPEFQKGKRNLCTLQPSALAAAHQDRGTEWWCWLRCRGAAPGRASALAPPGARTLAPGPLHLVCTMGSWHRDPARCHLFLQPASHQRGSWGAVCHVTPTTMLSPSFSVIFSRLWACYWQNHILLYLYPVLSVMPCTLICGVTCLK